MVFQSTGLYVLIAFYVFFPAFAGLLVQRLTERKYLLFTVILAVFISSTIFAGQAYHVRNAFSSLPALSWMLGIGLGWATFMSAPTAIWAFSVRKPGADVLIGGCIVSFLNALITLPSAMLILILSLE
jgi:hypothetical protein